MDIIDRRAAHQLGRTKFFTGKPCKYGHTVPRFVSSGMCEECNRKRSNAYQHKERGGLALRTYRIHPDDIEALDAYAVALQTARDVAEPLFDAAAVRAQAFPGIDLAPLGYVPPPFAPHPGSK